MAMTKASTDPAGISHPHSLSTSSGMPAIADAITGRPMASASISTTGRPSAKLGRTKALARTRYARMSSADLLPGSVTQSAKPFARIAASRSGLRSPSPMMVRVNRSPSFTSRSQASISSGRPFWGASLAMQQNSIESAAGTAMLSKKLSSTPQRMTLILGQSATVVHRINWLRPKLLIATTKVAEAILRPSA